MPLIIVAAAMIRVPVVAARRLALTAQRLAGPPARRRAGRLVAHAVHGELRSVPAEWPLR